MILKGINNWFSEVKRYYTVESSEQRRSKVFEIDGKYFDLTDEV